MQAAARAIMLATLAAEGLPPR